MKTLLSNKASHPGTKEERAAATTEMLARWYAIGGICEVTGRKLVPGATASIDHIVPKSKGGRLVASNLRWVHRIFNMQKGDLTDDENRREMELTLQGYARLDAKKAKAA